LNDELIKALEQLISASEPFLSGDVVDETSGTIPLIYALKASIEQAKEAIEKAKQ
jgi:hypothetical protein